MKWRLLIVVLIVGLGLTFVGVRALQTVEVSGVVLDEDSQPVEGATVRIQATTNSTTTGPDGAFTLDGLAEGVAVTVSAWKDLHYCGKVEGVAPPASGITLELRLYQTNDNPDYEWELPISEDPEHLSCAHCKLGVTEIWLENAHAGAGTNPRFFSMYNGTDTTGQPNVAPGYKLDFPNTAGSCANCHAPGAAANEPFTADMNELAGVNTLGVHCDFCHKIGGVYLDPATGLPYNNVPGAMSTDLRRPFPESERYQLFFGTFDDDNVPEEDTYLPLIEKSQFCAPCHQFSMWGTPIYQSFKEWLESPYPGFGVECQTCHMAPDGVMTNVAPGFGGVERDPMTIHAHTQNGAADEELLQNTVAMSVMAEQVVDVVQVTVTITNTQAGHHVPTDFPGRHMILEVKATGEQQQELAQVAGPVVPDWGGDMADRPGKTFAKVLRDLNSGEEPTAAYWNPTIIVSDNRIPAFGVDTSVYEFTAPSSGTVDVEATLVFRRAFWELMEDKRWDDTPDITMEQETDSIMIP